MHTKGPWEVRETRDGMTVRKSRKRLEIVYKCQGGGEQVIVGKHTGLDCLTGDNARLIAAAPELLAACKAISRYAAQGKTLDTKAFADLIVHDVRNAIAKAEGR
jgi:hypothetical protein